MISFQEENQKFNFRVGAIIISEDKTKVLLHTIKGRDFYLLPGGRVEWQEDSVLSIKRELAEEIGLTNINPILRLHIENFFTFQNVNYHEISNIFTVYLDSRHKFLDKHKIFCGLEGEMYVYQWVDITDINNYNLKPNLLKNVLHLHTNSQEHIILHENT